MRVHVLLSVLATGTFMSTGCKSSGKPVSAPMEVSAPASASPAPSPPAPRSTPAPPSSISFDSSTRELVPSREVKFEVRPLNGPGSMGPRVLSSSSEAALEEVRAWLEANPDAGRLRIDCSVNPMTMSSTPNPRWPAVLAQKVARWLVDHGVDCKRLEVVGWLDTAQTNGAERVRFFVDRSSARDPKLEARLDPCSEHD